ncbi:SDR family oxidoreductase [Pelagibacterium halotolerans]|uniref:Dehydrogenases with different specificities (Related to short-chain alcohol dehydrogenases) n=1 Tax=Pelagibacterium halotolerans (strain DSM 22347 / JCM 15775 / CGMCC 1.7692 / B2) TaxID=1082931 RepID=G4RAI9_PELHB|nr:SDR family oxidoreductase [Pelagibacterium halotolerans]AEQ51539.1 dehydrogenases with different specificities (related to short-chain alcohol dehydrogenases) [Pelagibacterium halotolerans B2]QJR18627.1 SDR family oxidoreductase [Pelagibacterium halotolerans]SEA16351.1 NADP-dependent 3-hydroxy acid dehydrogenase YdfG [Pelagibacterium halotolerans]
MNTVLITGCSSGFGLDTARYFLDRGWKVIATMRSPRSDLLPASDRLTLLPLDVTSDESVRNAVEAAGPIDVLVNNAGIGWLNALEGTPIDVTRSVFETNTLGTMRMIDAVLPQFRERKAGLIINVTSSVTMKPLPLLSVYTASKAAVNAFTESLALELAPLGIAVKIVLPGAAPDTSFGSTALSRLEETGGFPAPYAAFADGVIAAMRTPEAPKTLSSDVAEAIWYAANEASAPMRIPAGADAIALAQ